MKQGVSFNVTIEGLAELQRAFKKSPGLVKKYVNRAIKSSIYEIDKENVDSNLQFKTPRAQRTGRLQRSISANVYFGDMHGYIGPKTVYMNKVHANNEFMPRLLSKAQTRIDKHFTDAVSKILQELAN